MQIAYHVTGVLNVLSYRVTAGEIDEKSATDMATEIGRGWNGLSYRPLEQTQTDSFVAHYTTNRIIITIYFRN